MKLNVFVSKQGSLMSHCLGLFCPKTFNNGLYVKTKPVILDLKLESLVILLGDVLPAPASKLSYKTFKKHNLCFTEFYFF